MSNLRGVFIMKRKAVLYVYEYVQVSTWKLEMKANCGLITYFFIIIILNQLKPNL